MFDKPTWKRIEQQKGALKVNFKSAIIKLWLLGQSIINTT